MLNLDGYLSVDENLEVMQYTKLRLREPSLYKTAEGLTLYEQNILPPEKIIELCQKQSNHTLQEVTYRYVPPEIINSLEGTGAIPFGYIASERTLDVAILEDLEIEPPIVDGVEVRVTYVPIYNYFKLYVEIYGRHNDLNQVPIKSLINFIYTEAINNDASDITISSYRNTARVYYNIRKAKVYSKRILTSADMEDLIKLLTFQSPIAEVGNNPKYIGVNLNENWRGRVVINTKYKGWAITIRLLPNDLFNKTLEDCHITPEVIKFFDRDFKNEENGLRIIAGPTMSGKNTTMLAVLNDLAVNDDLKIVSVEMPVEVELASIEQIHCEDMSEFDANVKSLLRQNPDIVYISETGDTNAKDVLTVANTGKRVFTTIHANGVADIISRLQDITGLSTDRIVQCLHSMVYQNLVKQPDGSILPKCQYCYLSLERKQQLYGKSLGEIIKLINTWKGGDVW